MRLLNSFSLGLVIAGLFCGCGTSPQKRTPIPPPPPPPSRPDQPTAVTVSPLRMQEVSAVPEVPKVIDTDFPGLISDPAVLLVKRKGSLNEIAEFHRQNGGKVIKFKHIPWDAVEVPKGKEEKTYRKYKESKLFEHVEFQRTYNADVIPNDPLFSQQWDMTKIEGPVAWDKKTSNDVIVVVIDTGIDFTHPDLQGNLWTGPQGEHGYTAIGGVLTNGGRDDHFHGTHCAGTIGAVGNNGVGVVGINWRTKVLAMKFLTAGGSGSTRDAILCIEKMIDLKSEGHNIRVSNNSWGALGTDPSLEEAFLAAQNTGILNICAAGNNGFNTDERAFTPAAIPIEGIVSILASDPGDNKASFSNYGVESTDLLAPGVGIISTSLNAGYASASGTSMASPHVAGSMAMVFGLNPTLTVGQARSILLHPDSYDRTSFAFNSTGGGRLNLRKLWNNPLVMNPPPPNLPPVITRIPNTNLVFVAPGQVQPIGITATDPEGGALTYSMNWDTYRLPWFYRWMMGGAVGGAVTNFSGSVNTNTFYVTGKNLALDQSVAAKFAVSDGRGGGAGAQFTAFTFRNESKVYDIAKAIRGFKVWDDASGYPYFRLDMDTNYPALSSVQFYVYIYGGDSSGGGIGSPCCHLPNQDIRAPNDGFIKGSFSIRAHVMDGFGNNASSPQAQYFVGSTVKPPTVRMTINTNRGVAPLQVTADMSATLPGGATRIFYTVFLLNEGGTTVDIFNPVRQFTLTDPGTYAVEFGTSDFTQPLADRVIHTFTVLPAWPGPTLNIARSGTGVRIGWTSGVLQEAPNVTGPWTDSSNQNNPQNRPATGAKQFFRMR